MLFRSTPNLALEIGTARKQSIQLMYSINPWKVKDNKSLRHWIASPEYRWWFCHRFNGSFIGVHGLGGQYNISRVKFPFGFWKNMDDGHRYQGWMVGAGVSYGYQWILSKHWNLEAEIGVGYIHLNYKKYNCETCGEEIARKKKNYASPTKAGISLIYLF